MLPMFDLPFRNAAWEPITSSGASCERSFSHCFASAVPRVEKRRTTATGKQLVYLFFVIRYKENANVNYIFPNNICTVLSI